MEDEYKAYGSKENYYKESVMQWSRASGFPVNKELVYSEHKIAQEFDLIRNKLVLEFGCGNGTDGISYLKRGNQVVFCDIVPGNIDAARKNVGSLIGSAYFQFLEPGKDLPFDDNEFDIVNMHGVCMHIVEPLPVLKELVRVLKPGGHMYVMLYTEFLYNKGEETVKNFMERENLTLWQAFGAFTDGPGTPYARYYTEEEGRALFSEVGLTVLSTYVYNNYDFRTFKLKKE